MTNDEIARNVAEQILEQERKTQNELYIQKWGRSAFCPWEKSDVEQNAKAAAAPKFIQWLRSQGA